MALILLRGSSSQICPLLNEKTSDNKAHPRSFLTVDVLHLLHGKFWAGIFIILIGIKLYILPFSLLKPYCVVCKAWESKVPLPWHCQTNQAGPAGADRSRCNFTLHLCEATWTKLLPRWSHLTFESVRSAFEIEGFQFSHQLNCSWVSGLFRGLAGFSLWSPSPEEQCCSTFMDPTAPWPTCFPLLARGFVFSFVW